MSFGNHAEYGDAEKRQAQYNAALTGGAKGAGLGLSAALPAAYILHQRWSPFRQLTLPLKAFFVTCGTLVAGVIAADKAGIAFDREHYTDEGAKKLKQYHSREEMQWAKLAPRDKALTWAKDNKFSIVAGSWVVSMGGIFAYIHAQPMSFSQKLVQTRVWAQGLTLASLLGMAAITQIPSAGDKILKEREQAADHSWQDFIGESGSGGKKSGSGNEGNKNDGEAKSSSSSLSSTSQDSNKNSSGKSSKTTNNSPNASQSSNTNEDPTGKSSRSAEPNAPKQKAQTEKAPSSQTGAKAGYAGNN